MTTPNNIKVQKIITHKADDGRIEHDMVPSVNSLSPLAQGVLKKVRVLRDYTEHTGFHTTKSQNDLIQSLNGDDLASVLLVLKYNKIIPQPSSSPSRETTELTVLRS